MFINESVNVLTLTLAASAHARPCLCMLFVFRTDQRSESITRRRALPVHDLMGSDKRTSQLAYRTTHGRARVRARSLVAAGVYVSLYRCSPRETDLGAVCSTSVGKTVGRPRAYFGYWEGGARSAHLRTRIHYTFSGVPPRFIALSRGIRGAWHLIVSQCVGMCARIVMNASKR